MSNIPITPFIDPDDRQVLSVGETIAGSIDYYLDRDVFLLELQAGDQVIIRVSSPNIDAFLTVDAPFFSDDEDLEDDNSAVGILGVDARIVFESVTSGTYWVVVEDSGGYLIGGYTVSVIGV